MRRIFCSLEGVLVNLDKQNQLEYHYKKSIIYKLHQEGIISFIEYYESLLVLFEEHKIVYAK
jgi:chromosome condensin MukBEF MukE localization factor